LLSEDVKINATLRHVGTVSGVYTLGCLFGALGVTQLANRIGRRRSLIISAIVAAAGLIIEGSSFSLGQLIAGRIIAGFGNGGINTIVPVWQSEVTKPRNRGLNVVLLGTFVGSGIALISWVNFGLSFIQDTEVAWRLPIILPVIFPLQLLAFTMSFPESPRWLISQGRIEEARESMVILAEKGDVNDEVIDIEINAITQALGESSNSERGFIDLFKPGRQRLFYRWCLAVLVNLLAQMTGANAVTYYGTTIFKESLGLAPRTASLLNAVVLTYKILGAVVSFLIIDRVGRQTLFMVSGAGMAVAMSGMAGTVWAINNAYTFGASAAATFFMFLYFTFYPVGFQGPNFLYGAEIAPQDLRIHIAASGTAAHWLFNFVIAEITPIAIVQIGWRYYIVFAAISASIVVLAYFFFPETKGRSLEEMDILFSEPKHWYQVAAFSHVMKRSALADLENNGNLKAAHEFEHSEVAVEQGKEEA
jgi:sugar porter (SP) family MFS transporter